MNEFKPLIASRTFWGASVAIVAGVAGIWKYHITPDEVAQMTDLLTGLGASVGGLLAIYGRVMATKQIGSQNDIVG